MKLREKSSQSNWIHSSSLLETKNRGPLQNNSFVGVEYRRFVSLPGGVK